MQLELDRPDARGGVLRVPPTASASECAALAAAMGAHLTDQLRRAPDTSDQADRWALAGRIAVRDPNRLPRRIRRGEEWKIAGRLRQ